MFWNKTWTFYIQEMTIKTNLRFYKITHFLTVVVVVIVELQKSRNIWNNCKIRTESTCSNNIETFICSNCNRLFLWKHKVLSNIIWEERGVETVLFRVYKSTFSTQTATFHSTLLKRKFMNYRNTDFNVKTLWKTTSGFRHYKKVLYCAFHVVYVAQHVVLEYQMSLSQLLLALVHSSDTIGSLHYLTRLSKDGQTKHGSGC